MLGAGDQTYAPAKLAHVSDHAVGLVFVGMIERRTSLPKQKVVLGGLNPAVVNEESTSHEFGHYFAVNPNGDGGHCQQVMWTKVGKKTPKCTMKGALSAGDFGDGNPYFHYAVSPAGAVNSEYLDVRKNK